MEPEAWRKDFSQEPQVIWRRLVCIQRRNLFKLPTSRADMMMPTCQPLKKTSVILRVETSCVEIQMKKNCVVYVYLYLFGTSSVNTP